MFKSLLLKELRETYWIALLGLVVHLAIVAICAGYEFFWLPNNDRPYIEVPIIDSGFLFYFCVVSMAVAVALGFRQTLGESLGNTWLFLLHRPASLRKVLAAKLFTGMALYLACGIIPIVSFAAWSSTPGSQSGPFFWWMTYAAWSALGITNLFYLAAFLAGLRPARWFGTRLLPLVAAGPLAFVVVLGSFFPFAGRTVQLVGFVLLLIAAAYLIGLIYYTAQSRDFS